MSAITKHVTVHGRVQGVGFRAWTKKTAEQHNISGWVRNRRGGTVEAVFHGSAAKIETMMKVLKYGPVLADIKDIESRDKDDYEGPTGSFEIRQTR